MKSRSLGRNDCVARLWNDRRGATAIIFALSMPLVSAGAAFGVETAYWHYEKLKLQEMADVAAYGGAIEKRAGKDDASIAAAARAVAARNGFKALEDAIEVHAPPQSGPFAGGDAVEVVLSRSLKRFFSQMFIEGPVVVKARSVSAYTTAGNACVLALDPSAPRAAHFAGSSNTVLRGCNVMSNSQAQDSVYVQGSAHVETPCIMSAGGVELNSGVRLTACAAAMTDLPPVADPYRHLPTPPDTGGCADSRGAALQPGRYCGGLSLGGDVSLAPGVYYIAGGTLKVNANANVSGAGVTLYFAQNAGLQINGNATVTLSAPTTGAYQGVLMYGARTNTSGAVTINGTAASAVTGAMYFPGQSVSYLGNFSGANGCTQLVARRVEWTGSTTVDVDCTSAGMPPIKVAGVIRLAE